MNATPPLRLRALNEAPAAPQQAYVLYWMVAYRRLRWNFALQRAVELANAWGRPLVILEALRVGYPYASDRLHRFILDGMAHNVAEAQKYPGVLHRTYVEPQAGDGSGLLALLAQSACAVVTDDWPGFFVPRMQAAAASRLHVRLEAVDSNGLLPLAAADKPHPTAHAFRRHLHKTLPPHLAADAFPLPDPLADLRAGEKPVLDARVSAWAEAGSAMLEGHAGWADGLAIDHRVAPVGRISGGKAHAQRLLDIFMRERLARYEVDRNEPALEGGSGLSPYLHFGHISAHEVAHAVFSSENWTPGNLSPKPTGSKAGWWGLSSPTEAFLDELVTWREVGLNVARLLPNYDRYESLPPWAQATLAKHTHDPRPWVYSLAQLEAAETHDKLWNAAQRQLVREGRIHNYLRMLWGKKILEWSPTPQDALSVLLELNDRYALDGRDPNSVSGIFWCLGRFDRAWGPERSIFGTIRYMSSDNTARKMDVKPYLARYGP